MLEEWNETKYFMEVVEPILQKARHLCAGRGIPLICTAETSRESDGEGKFEYDVFNIRLLPPDRATKHMLEVNSLVQGVN